MARNWFWQLEEERGGPDWLFRAEVASSEAKRLFEFVRAFPLRRFVNTERFASKPAKCEFTLCYLDDESYLKSLSKRKSEREFWLFNELQLCDHKLRIWRHYTGNASSGQAETEFLIALAKSPLLIARWGIWQSGYGELSDRIFASGTSSAELLTYLQAD